MQVSDGEGIDQNSSNKAIPALVIPVGVTFLVVSCVAVAGGFVGGFFKSPRGTQTWTLLVIFPPLTSF
jgi:hypothetical protein